MISVLVVDDDFMVARVNRGYVQRIPGFTVVAEAHTGAAALAAVDDLRPDLVLLDVYLPDISGLEVLRRLRGHTHPPVDVLPVTAARNLEAVREAMHGGAVHYLVKPFTFAALRDKLERYARARHTLDRTEEPSQADIDHLFGSLHGPTARPLPKGLSQASCELVARALDESSHALSAMEVAHQVGMSRASARRYLEHLVQAGHAELHPHYGGTGRPEHRYQALPRRTAQEES